ncbi:hypothetical protein HQ531_09570 [bacterium]|nr:hypothetical protein [bacterium]
MKKTGIVLILGLTQIFCDDYLNVQCSSGYEHCNMDDISKITFGSNGSEINFVLSSGTTSTKTIDDIVKMVFGTTAQGDVSLPVELVSFTAIRENTDVILTWETASEVENYGFEIERIHAGTKVWTKIGFVEGNGSVTTASEYSFTDSDISLLNNLKYRLKQIDLSGGFEYSPEVCVTRDDPQFPFEYRLHNNYPNPFYPTTTIRYEIMKEGLTRLIIYDLLGCELEVLVNEHQAAGGYEIKFNASDYGTGV